MRRFLAVVLVVLGLVLAGIAAIVWSGNTLTVIALLAGPPHSWDEKRLAPAPDYASQASWAAWPDRGGLADYRPQGEAAAARLLQVDVFFVHPTGYMKGHDWNAPLGSGSRTEENTQWMMANQASIFNGVARVYAPRYRQASLFRYISASEDVGRKASDLAYSDVERAFEYFLATASRGRPFIIAGHSQGTQHAFRLLKEKIDGTPLERLLVAAYILGSDVTNEVAAGLKSIRVCSSAEQTGCLVHWAAMGEGGSPPPGVSDLVCVNPLSWKRDGGRMNEAAHKGGVPISGALSAQMFGSDAAQGMEFPPLGSPMPAMTWAECRDGFLYVSDLVDSVYKPFILPGKNYHGLDFPLFHMDIRNNAAQRSEKWLARSGASPVSPAAQE
jgi:hypothetical protein